MQAAVVVESDSAHCGPLLRDGASVRLRSNYDDESYLGVDAEGKVVCNLSRASPHSLFKVKARGRAPGSEVDQISLINAGAKYLRVNAKGDVDCLGGGGRWTLFQPLAFGSGISLKSIANAGKCNDAGTEWYLAAQDDGALSGNAVPFSWIVEEVAAPVTKDEMRQARLAAKEARVAERANMTKEQRIAAKEARLAERKAQKESELLSGWTKVDGTAEDAQPKKAASPAKSKAKAAKMPEAAVPKAVPKPKKVPVEKEFPSGAVSLAPIGWQEVQNRKGSVGWNIGCSPNGYLVPDCNDSSWGTWTVERTAEGHVRLAASHTPAFHLAINPHRELTHRGGKGAFATFAPIKHGRFWSLRCVGHSEENPAFLAVSSSGLLHVASKESKATRFLVSAATCE